MQKKAIIIGAGPAGLTAAYELLKRTGITPIILEKSRDIGGISKTVNYKGNRMDIGGHRFFSKSDRVMQWWLNILPMQTEANKTVNLRYQQQSTHFQPTAENIAKDTDSDKVMLVRRRLSRIYFLRKFFTYPITLSIDTLRKLGLVRTLAILFSYLRAQLFPRKPEQNLEDFMINRFGKVLYRLFFQDYTEKVWGVPCKEISAEWGAQRIKGVSIGKAIAHAVKEITKRKKKNTGNNIAQKDTETSLIEQFLYPKLGPGQLWEEVARQVQEMGGIIHMHHDVKEIYNSNNQVTAIVAVNNETGKSLYLEGDYFFSTMPVKELIGGMQGIVPDNVREIASGLLYRDFITVGILLKRMATQNQRTGDYEELQLKDNWIYIQDAGVKVGRLQLFHNWSPHMVANPDNVWIGMEFFCNETDAFWQLPDEEIKTLAIAELAKIGLIAEADVLDGTVLRVPKTYPAYFGAYERFDEIRDYTDTLQNLFLVGRNGMHKYNNADHSMLTAMVAVDNICAGVTGKDNLWAINTEQEYHEEKEEKTEPAVTAEEKTMPERQSVHQELAATGSFKDFLLHNKQNRRFLLFALIAMIAQWIIFKYFYPFASYIHGDSFSYIRAAAGNADINTYPVGYSRFLRLFSVFSNSDLALTSFQYLLAQAGGLFFLFTLYFFHQISRVTQYILVGVLVLNPLFLYMANLVSSDCLFMSLSFTWFALLLWIVHRPGNRIIFWHTVVLAFAFTVRYNALIYPAIAFIAFLLARLGWYKKAIGIALPAILIGLFIFYTGNKYKVLTGTFQFSPFSGWQAANNALYAYRYVDSADRKPVPVKFQVLDSMVRRYFDTHRDVRKFPFENIKASTVYMWTRHLPLLRYRDKIAISGKDTAASELKKWALMGPFFQEYGAYILKQYPMQYAEHFLWPNLIKYYAPPVEFLENYNGGKDSVSPVARSWFHYKSNNVYSRIENPKAYILYIYPVLSGSMNVVLLCCLICFVWLRGFRREALYSKPLILVTSFWLLNAAFTIVASPAAIRLQAFPMLLETSFAIILVAWLWKLAAQAEPVRLMPKGVAAPQPSL